MRPSGEQGTNFEAAQSLVKERILVNTKSWIMVPTGVLPVERKGGSIIGKGLKGTLLLLYSKQSELKYQMTF